jgi:hypothetical protein
VHGDPAFWPPGRPHPSQPATKPSLNHAASSTGEPLRRLRKHCEKVSWTGGGEHAAQVLSSAPRAAATTGANGVTAHSSGASRCRRERPARTSPPATATACSRRSCRRPHSERSPGRSRSRRQRQERQDSPHHVTGLGLRTTPRASRRPEGGRGPRSDKESCHETEYACRRPDRPDRLGGGRGLARDRGGRGHRGRCGRPGLRRDHDGHRHQQVRPLYLLFGRLSQRRKLA